MKKALSLALMTLIVFSMLSILQINPVMAAMDEYFIYSRFDPPGIGDVVGVGGYVEYYGVPEWGDEIQYVYFLSGTTGYKVRVTVTDGDGDGKIDPRQHPSHYLSEFQGSIEPRHFEIISSANLAPYAENSGTYAGHAAEFYVDSSGVYFGAYPHGIHRWDHDWNYIGKIANNPPTRTESMAYNPSENVWYAGGRSRTIYQLSDTDSDGSFLDESWVAIFTYPNYGGSHHDGMEYVGGYLWISDMTSDVIGKWEYDTATSTWKELKRFTYTETADVEGMGFGPNDHFWCGSGWGSGSYIYELGNEITKGYPLANAGDDVDAHPPTIPVEFDASGSHHTDPAKEIVLYEWDFESDGTWDYSGTDLTVEHAYPAYYYVPYFSQRDPAWANELLGGDGPKISSAGCALTSATMVMAYYGVDTDPKRLNDLIGRSGYDANYYIYWSVVAEKCHTDPNQIKYEGKIEPYSSEEVSKQLDAGRPVIVEVPGHFVVVTSREGDTYYINDPWDKDIKTLDHYPTRIGLRIFSGVPRSIDWDKTAKAYTATLRVTDNSDPPLQDIDTCIVHITSPPWKPVADPDGPYEGYEKTPVQLDGTKSYDPESRMFALDHPWYETIATYEWDLDNDGEFDDATGSNPTHTWNSEGIYTIRLKVTDSQPSGPDGTIGPLDVDTEYSTVVIKSGVSLNVGLIPVDTSDDTIQHDVSYFEDLGEKLREYFTEVSYGFVNINVQVHTESDGSWFSVPQSTAWYRQSADREEKFIEHSIESSDDSVNFKLYDYGDEEGKGIAVFIPRNYLFYAPAFFKNNGLRGQWSTDDGVKIDAIIVPELRFQDNLKIVRGLAHEVAHWVGKVLVTVSWWPGWPKDGWWALPDVYLMGGGRPPVDQRWCLMGNWMADDIEAVHLSSFCKEWLGWLEYSDVSKGNSYDVKSLTTLSYGDEVFRYVYRKPWWELLPHYHILEVRTDSSTHSDWDIETRHEKALAIYEVDQRVGDRDDTINLVNTLTSAPDEFRDPDAGVTYKLISLEKAGAQVSVEEYKAKKLKGASLTTLASVLSAVQPIIPHEVATSLPIPDIDLHAYSEEGDHVGMNYETGEYEIEIPDALCSGDLGNGREWIFVSEDLDVHFMVGAEDNAKFLNSFPEAGELTDGIETYTISIVYYDPDENRYESSPVSQEIMPGEEIVHRFAIIPNPDGTYTPVIDDNPPLLAVEVPQENAALQDGVTLTASAWDENGVSSVTFSIREPNGDQGTIISPDFEYMSASPTTDDMWELPFDTILLPDGFYLAYVEATDVAGNIASDVVPFSIRNWATVELLPASESNKGGRTMPVKFSLRVIEAVDPAQPFVYNEELTIIIYEKGHPENILQESTFGTTARDYRIDTESELYITNFKTMKKPTTYVVEIWRKGMLIGTFEFSTVK